MSRDPLTFKDYGIHHFLSEYVTKNKILSEANVNHDPMQNQLMHNPYAYAASSPTVLVDPSGQIPIPNVGGTLGADVAGSCCYPMPFFSFLTVCVGVQGRGHAFGCCDGRGRPREGVFGEGCFSLGVVLTGTVKPGCNLRRTPRPQAGSVLSVCPKGGCGFRGCLVCSIGVEYGWFNVTFGCRICSRSGGPAIVCGINIGSGTGCSGQICYTCSKLF